MTMTPTPITTTSTNGAGRAPVADVIDVATVQQLLHADPTVRLIDVRTAGEYESAHIPGSYNVPLDSLGEHAAEFAALDHPVVLLCQTGARSTQAHGALTSAGKQQLHMLEGGMAAWQAAGGDVVHGTSEKWALDRQVRFVAGSLSLVGILASIAVPKAKWLAGGVASGLVFSAVSNTCAMGNVLMKLPYNRSNCDIEGVLSEMRLAA
ncbi:MAG: rhodanese-like domain-containing protein [Ilumatobacter sp.]|nr:rhodanese-like domain-containing protein [Ilumatobacter sp.]